jgi:hypothetical protein
MKQFQSVGLRCYSGLKFLIALKRSERVYYPAGKSAGVDANRRIAGPRIQRRCQDLAERV